MSVKSRGVSLLEVMFAIGVIGIGLLGVMAVIPLGLYQAGHGNLLDRATAAGLNAIEDFDVRGMRRPENWLYVDGSPVMSPVKYGAAPHVAIGYSFCLDPRFVSAPANSTVAVSGTPLDARFFPYAAPSGAPALTTPFNNTSLLAQTVPFTQDAAQPRMARITLRASGITSYLSPMSALQADRIFVSEDELVFDIPEESTLPPVQNDANGIRRLSEGTVSWLATIVPRSDSGAVTRGVYTLSIVILHKRDPELAMWEDANANGTFEIGEETGNERVLNVLPPIEGAGYAGGDLVLQAASPEALQINEGEWVLLGGSAGVGGTNAEAPEFKWFRVAIADTQPNLSGSVWELNITLQGADWQRPEWHFLPTDTRFRPTQATIVKGVVAVYERTVQLETTTLWQQ
jgi:hypothetical protein